MRCIITGQQTDIKTNTFYPISRTGRELLPRIIAKHNQRIKEAFIEAQKEKGIDDELLGKLAPKVSKKYALQLIYKQEPDMMMTIDQVMEEDIEE